MLTLGRKPGEYIVINGNIVVTVDEEDGIFRVSVDAPREVSIVRGEVYEKDRPRPACLDDAFTKNNILNQAAQSMLAQANQVPQGVLQLLQ